VMCIIAYKLEEDLVMLIAVFQSISAVVCWGLTYSYYIQWHNWIMMGEKVDMASKDARGELLKISREATWFGLFPSYW